MATFLFSSFTGLPDQHFEGYCFVGSDYIAGPGGHAKFQASRNVAIQPGEDGCYLTILRDDGGHRVGVDFSGYMKLFYFSRDGVWGVSNSPYRLARHLRSHSISVAADPAQLVALNIETTITSQLSTFDTIFSGIKLLPSYCSIRVGRAGFVIEQREPEIAKDYTEGLHSFVQQWVERFETLLSVPGLEVSCDLTGGKDSRVVYALLTRAQQRLGRSGGARVLSSRVESLAADWKAASTIAAHYRTRLNPPTKKAPRLFGGAHTFETWRVLNAGVYFPVYFPSIAPDPMLVHFHGGGGENHRPFYPVATADEMLASHIPTVEPRDLFDAWGASFLSSVDELVRRTPNVDPMILHYREFRGRMHGGRAPQYRVVMSPLAGKLMEPLSNYPGKASGAQVHFDIMESALPGLIEFPYDKPGKGPTATNRQNLTKVSIDEQANPGTAFIEASDIDLHQDGIRPLDLLAKAFECAQTPDVLKHMGKIARKARAALPIALERGKFPHPSDGKNVSRIISAYLALEPAG